MKTSLSTKTDMDAFLEAVRSVIFVLMYFCAVVIFMQHIGKLESIIGSEIAARGLIISINACMFFLVWQVGLIKLLQFMWLFVWPICWRCALVFGSPIFAWSTVNEITWKIIITAVVFIIANLIMMWIEDLNVKQSKCPFNL